MVTCQTYRLADSNSLSLSLSLSLPPLLTPSFKLVDPRFRGYGPRVRELLAPQFLTTIFYFPFLSSLWLFTVRLFSSFLCCFVFIFHLHHPQLLSIPAYFQEIHGMSIPTTTTVIVNQTRVLQVKNKAPAPVQITAESLIYDILERKPECRQTLKGGWSATTFVPSYVPDAMKLRNRALKETKPSHLKPQDLGLPTSFGDSKRRNNQNRVNPY
jgi:hypothetical protein